MDDDGQLIQQTLSGDTAAFGRLVQKHQERLCSSLRHVLGSIEEAEDVAQDAFTQAFTRLASFQGRSAFYTWLYRIAVNLGISRRRRRRPEVSVEGVRESSGVDPTDATESPLEHIERRERVKLVHDTLAMLNEEHRTILVLRELDGCDYEAIGEILELPVGTVRSRLHRARLQLKRQLETAFKDGT